MNKQELVNYINEHLKIADFEDDSANGLQVDCGKSEIKKIGYAVDSTNYIFDLAVEKGVDMVLCHHGMFWGKEQVMTGLFYEKIKVLLANDIALYGAHLPLDAHPKLGNNVQLCQAWVDFFELKNYKMEAAVEYHGSPIGFGIRFENGISVDELNIFCEKNRLKNVFYNFGKKEKIFSVMFGSGGCGDDVSEAKQKDFDLFIVGEINHRHMLEAKELGQSVLCGGHYETEIFGVRALAEKLAQNFDLEIVFLDVEPYGD